MIPVLAFVGRSNSGKTTLLVKLIPELRKRGYRVAVVKHTRHQGVETDLPGKDTRRLWEAGAEQTVFCTPDRIVHTRRVPTEPSLREILRGIQDVDLVILEGYKQEADVPKIEVVRAERSSEPLDGLSGRIACVSDVSALACDEPCFDLEDIEALASFIETFIVVHRGLLARG